MSISWLEMSSPRTVIAIRASSFRRMYLGCSSHSLPVIYPPPNGNLKPETAEAVSDNDYFFAGANQEIKAYVNSHPGIWKRGVIAAARRLVAIEIDAYPGIVAEPISILTVYASGHRGWINPGKCNGGHADTEPSKGNTQKPSQRRKH